MGITLPASRQTGAAPTESESEVSRKVPESLALEPDGTIAVPTPAEPATRGMSRYALAVVVMSFLAWTLVSIDSALPGLSLTKISESLRLSLSSLEYLLGAFNLAVVIAPVLLGRYVDRMGRKRLLQLSLIGTGIFGGLTAVAANVWQFVVIRVIAGTSYGLVEPAVNTVVSEEAPPRWRGLIMGFVQAGYPVGSAIAGTLATAILPGAGWRALFLVAFGPVLVVLLATRLMREPKRFTDMRSTAKQLSLEHKPGWRPLFSRELRRQTIVTSLYGICINAGVALVLTVATVYLVHVDHLELSQATFLFSMSNWAALAGQLFVGWLADHLPSKWIIVGFALVSAVFLVVFAVPGATYATAAVALIGFGFFGNGTFGAYPRYTTESFPTEFRGTGTSFSLGMSFISFAFMPIIAGTLIESSAPRAIPLIAAALVVAGAVTMAFGRKIRPRSDLHDFVPRARTGA